jgi:hypothetical protein
MGLLWPHSVGDYRGAGPDGGSADSIHLRQAPGRRPTSLWLLVQYGVGRVRDCSASCGFAVGGAGRQISTQEQWVNATEQVVAITAAEQHIKPDAVNSISFIFVAYLRLGCFMLARINSGVRGLSCI